MDLHIELVTGKEYITVEEVLSIFAHGEWTKNRTQSQVKKMLEYTDFLVMAKVDGRPVGFARMITDRTFRAFVEDVIVLTDFRRCGVGRLMMLKIEEFVKALDVPRMELTTTQTGFWERLGYIQRVGSTYMIKNLS